MSEISNSLRCKYPIGRIMENGYPEFGWRDFSGEITLTLPTPIMLSAADHIDAIEKKCAELLTAAKLALTIAESHISDIQNEEIKSLMMAELDSVRELVGGGE